jgi:hypothetical protein
MRERLISTARRAAYLPDRGVIHGAASRGRSLHPDWTVASASWCHTPSGTELAGEHVELDLAPPVGHRPASTKATISSRVG